MTSRRGPHPLLYFVLFLPFGASGGFVSIALGYLARRAGVSMTEIAWLVALTVMAQTVKFAWAPFIDVLWTRKGWYLAANVTSSITLALMGFIAMSQANLPLIKALVLVNSLAASVVAMGIEGIMAHATPDEERGRAGGFSQAGYLGGFGLGGGLGLSLITHLEAPWMATSILAALLLACGLALRPLPEPPKHARGLVAGFRHVGVDLWKLITARSSILPFAICFLPAGAGAASGLFSSIAGAWNASEHLVAIMQGTLSGLVMIVGCLAAAPISDAMNRKGAYVLSAGFLAAVTALVAVLPRTPSTYALLCLSYAFAAGLVYGTWSAFVLETIGAGAAATKYNIFAALANIPISYMTIVNGHAADRWGPSSMLLVDAASGAVGLVLLLLLVVVLKLAWPDRQPVRVPIK